MRGSRELAVSEAAWTPPTFEAADDGDRLEPWLDSETLAVRKALEAEGIALLRGFARLEPDALHRAVTRISGTPQAYDERSTPRRMLGEQVYSSTEYPADQDIFLHNENSYASRWPGHLYFYAADVDCTGGETPVANNRDIHDAIDVAVRDEMIERGLLHRRTFIADVGMRPEQVFNLPDGISLETHLGREGYHVGRHRERLTVDYRHQPFIIHPERGEACWFNHAAFFQGAGLDEATRAALDHLYEGVLPNQMLYGNGEPIPEAIVGHLRSAYASQARVRPWRRGDLLVLDNMRYAHGRRPFAGERSIWVVMARPIARSACGV